MKEIWKNIPGFNGDYQISNYGRIKSFKRKEPKILKQGYDGRKYRKIMLCKNGKRTNPAVHTLVAKLFVPNPKNKPTVNHIDCNKDNNRADNLEWMTYSENSLHGRKNGCWNTQE